MEESDKIVWDYYYNNFDSLRQGEQEIKIE